MAELSTSRAGKDGYSFTGELSERITHLSPAILNLPFDNSISVANNILSSPDYTSFLSWSGVGVYFQNRTLDNGTFGPFFGNDIYRCEKYGAAVNFSYYINNISTFTVPTEFVTFTCVVKSSTTTSSYNPFSIAVMRGNKGGASNEYTTGELVWRRDEYLTDGFWRLAICLRLRSTAVPSQYRSNYSFEISAPWANTGTYVWACAPAAYSVSELFGYSPSITLSGDYIQDPSGLIIDSPTTNYIDFSTAPSAWDASILTPAFWYKNVWAYKALSGAGGNGITYATNPSLEIASGSSAFFSVWVKRTTGATQPINSLSLAGAIWESAAWTNRANMSAYVSISEPEYFDEYHNKLALKDKSFLWHIIKFRVTNTHTDKIRFSQVTFYNTLLTRGAVFYGAPQYESGDFTWFTSSSRTSQGSISIPCKLKAPYTICFKYRPTIKVSSIVDVDTSPTIIQLGTYDSAASLRLYNTPTALVASGKDDTGVAFSQNLKTFTASEWDYTEYLYTIVAENATTFKIYLNSILLGTLTTGTFTYTSSIALGASTFTKGIYKDLTVLPRALALSEIGDVVFSIKRTTDPLRNKETARITAGRELKEPINLLVSDWGSDPLYVTGTLDSVYSAYTQTNCSVFLTQGSSSSGKYCYCIKRPPNILNAAQNMWGGIQLNLPENAKIEGRKYRFIYKYKGQTSMASETPYLAYSVGWTSYGVGLTSQAIAGSAIPLNTNTKEWKTASGTYTVFNRWQKGSDNNIYDTYRQLKIGWGYEDTGALGTKIFVDDIQIYDITDDANLVAFYSSSAEASYPANTIWDSSGNGYNCTTTDITTTKDGPQNKLAAYFNGTSSKITGNATVSPPYALSFWVKPKRIPSSGSEIMFHSGTSLGVDRGFWVAAKPTGVLSIGVPTSASLPEYNTSASYLTVDTLYHIVINFYSDKTELFKNGALTHSFASGMSTTLDPGFMAGQDNGSKYFMGNIGDVRFFNRVLLPSEVALLNSFQYLTAGDFKIKKTGIYSRIASDTNRVYLVGTAGTAGDITISGVTEAKWDDVSLSPLSSTGLCLLIWDEAGAVLHRQTYNVATVDADRISLASKLATIQGNQYWALLSYSSCGTNTTLNNQLIAMSAVQYAAYNWSTYPNSAYVAFGMGQVCFKEDLRTYGNDRWYATLSLSL